jgi:hypothetical protein
MCGCFSSNFSDGSHMRTFNFETLYFYFFTYVAWVLWLWKTRFTDFDGSTHIQQHWIRKNSSWNAACIYVCMYVCMYVCVVCACMRVCMYIPLTSAWTVGLILLTIHNSMDNRSVLSEYGYSSFKKYEPFTGAPVDKISISSKMARKTAIKFQQLRETVSLNKTAWAITSLK